jgi:hypothetical protein
MNVFEARENLLPNSPDFGSIRPWTAGRGDNNEQITQNTDTDFMVDGSRSTRFLVKSITRTELFFFNILSKFGSWTDRDTKMGKKKSGEISIN